MTPLEIAAKAHWADSENTAWENLLPQDRAHMIGVMRAALAAIEAAGFILLPVKAAGEWRTMESAPRDGTPVLCALRGNPPLMLPMMWRDGFWWDDIDRGFDEAVTHWRPLPAPPETGT